MLSWSRPLSLLLPLPMLFPLRVTPVAGLILRLSSVDGLHSLITVVFSHRSEETVPTRRLGEKWVVVAIMLSGITSSTRLPRHP